MQYLIVIAILLIGVLKYDKNSDTKGAKLWLAIEWLAIVLLAGLRYRVGGDSLSYYDDFYASWPTLAEISSYDFGRYGFLWVLFASICKTIVNDFAFLQIIHAIITTSVFFWFFKKHTKHYFVAIIIYFIGYFFRYNTEVIRGTLGVCAFLVGYEYLIKKKYFAYFITCLIAVGFHYEGICTFFFPFALLLKNIKLDSIKIVLFIIISYVLFLALDFLPILGSLIPEGIIYDQFINYSDVNAKFTGLGYLYIGVMVIPLMFILGQYKNENDGNGFKPFVILYTFLYFFSFRLTHIISRPMDFILPMILVALVDYLYDYAGGSVISSNKKIISIFVLLLFMYPRIMYLVSQWVLFYPYYSILNPVDSSLREYYYYQVIFG